MTPLPKSECKRIAKALARIWRLKDPYPNVKDKHL